MQLSFISGWDIFALVYQAHVMSFAAAVQLRVNAHSVAKQRGAGYYIILQDRQPSSNFQAKQAEIRKYCQTSIIRRRVASGIAFD